MDDSPFVYDRFSVSDDRRTASFEYTTSHGGQTYHLAETLEFPVPLADTPPQQRSLRALHLALGVSYYKKFLASTIVHPYAMDETEAEFWNNMWQGGYSEFMYVNKLPSERLAKFAAQEGLQFEGGPDAEASGALLGIGGGKDSIVAGELLKALGVPVTGFVLATGEQLGQSAAVAETMGVELLAVERTIDKQLAGLKGQPGVYSGHIPISLVFALVGTALAIARGTSYVIVANEASASIPRVEWQGKAVNHQWSKSFEAEAQIQSFVQTCVHQPVTYFSAIRQLTSLGVAKLFANFPKYFEVFTSDNYMFRIDPAKRPTGRWSLESPKSLSSYILLAPWLSDEDVSRIFGMQLLDEPPLNQLFLELTGVEGEQPLDCVGTVEELVLSMNLLAGQNRYPDTALMQLARERGVVKDGDWEAALHELLQLQPDEALPPELHTRIATYFKERLAA
ncbi:MAG TPA: hypothetical protein VLF40_03340 [Candidatus Saccharimonadales bacterium]|nr:hypothetical protein [Candidatus Saccharimonadales bacterium]